MAQVTYLLETPRVVVGEFRCPPRDRAWHETNNIGRGTHLVFPLVPVVIRQEGEEPVLATSNHTILYGDDRRYERELRDARGDECVFIALRNRPAALRTTHVPTAAKTYLLQHALVRELRRGAASTGRAEARALAIAAATLQRPAAPQPDARRAGTAHAHRALAEEAKSELARTLEAPPTLRELGRRLGTSAFHLARVFRAETGFSVDGYGRALRLRAALERLPTLEDGLTSLALELGFSSHSHFTALFRREFGVTPSRARDDTLLATALSPA